MLLSLHQTEYIGEHDCVRAGSKQQNMAVGGAWAQEAKTAARR